MPSFSFNWAGISVPNIDAQGSIQRGNQAANQAAQGFGMGARGIQRMVDDKRAAKEYSDILANYQGPQQQSPEVAAIQQELTRLKARNAEIARRLGLGNG